MADAVEEETPEYPSSDRATQFSDSLALSFPYRDYRDLLRLIRQVTSYQHSMLLLGLPLRGGITVGPLHHEGAQVFGPAMNEAYNLEHKAAKNPRVIIAKRLESDVLKATKLMPRRWPLTGAVHLAMWPMITPSAPPLKRWVYRPQRKMVGPLGPS